jgi:hypothetical protein
MPFLAATPAHTVLIGCGNSAAASKKGRSKMARTWKDSGYRGGRKSGGKRRHGFGNGDRAATRTRRFEDLQFDNRQYVDGLASAQERRDQRVDR